MKNTSYINNIRTKRKLEIALRTLLYTHPHHTFEKMLDNLGFELNPCFDLSDDDWVDKITTYVTKERTKAKRNRLSYYQTKRLQRTTKELE